MTGAYTSKLVGGLENVLFFHILGISSSQLKEGLKHVETTNQIMYPQRFKLQRSLCLCQASGGRATQHGEICGLPIGRQRLQSILRYEI